MAVVAVKSTLITGLDAKPVSLAPGFKGHGRLRETAEVFDIANTDSVGSTYRVLRVFSSWRVTELLLDSPDIGTTTAADVGLYRISGEAGGAVVDADFFASALSLNGGALTKSDITVESGVVTTANRAKRIWEQLGLSADPAVWYDVTFTLTGAADAAGAGNLLRLRYVDGT